MTEVIDRDEREHVGNDVRYYDGQDCCIFIVSVPLGSDLFSENMLRLSTVERVEVTPIFQATPNG